MDPREKGPKPPHATVHQEYPGTEAEMVDELSNQPRAVQV